MMQVREMSTGKVLAMKVLNEKDISSTDEAQAKLIKIDSPFLTKLHDSFETADKLNLDLT